MDHQLRKSERFVALLGNAGSGKSYFLQNQFVPFFQAKASREAQQPEGPWRVLSFSPRINPIGTLASALATPGILRGKQAVQPFFREQLEQQLRAGNDGLVNVYRDAVQSGDGKFRLLIIVDQLEDMFRIGDELKQKDRAASEVMHHFFQRGDDTLFFNLFLKVLTTEIPVYLVFSIGSENLDRLNAFQGWPERISMHRYSLPQIAPKEVIEALKIPPAGENTQPQPEGAAEITNQIINDYLKLAAEKKELAARVNVALYLLRKQSIELLAAPFAGLQDPPPFVKRVLEESKASPRRAELLKERLLQEDNRRDWEDWYLSASAAEKEKWETGLTEYFAGLTKHYNEFGGLEGAPDYLYNSIYQQFSADEKELTARLFKFITLKDPSPEIVAASYAAPFGTIREVCFRGGEEYPEILQQLGFGTGYSKEGQTKLLSAQEKSLRKVIRYYNFAGGVIPDMVRWVNPSGQASGGHPVALDDTTLVQLGSSALLQEWSKLRTWVGEEYAAANIYLKLTADAQLHYSEKESKPDSKASAPNTHPFIPGLSFWKEIWSSFTGVIGKMRGEKSTENDKAEESEGTLLSEGQVELVRDWLLNTLPSQKWAAKYRPAEITVDPTDEHGPAFTKWVEEGEWNAFNLAISYWKDSNSFHVERRKKREAKIRHEIKTQQKRARRMGWLAGIAVICGVFAVILGWQAKEARNNLRLLDFVDTMTKTNLIPANTYRSDYFRELKENIEGNRKIRDKSAVVDSLAKWGILQFRKDSTNSSTGAISKRALLQLDSLIDNYHDETTGGLGGVTASIIRTADQAAGYNMTSARENLQFPYVYQVLWENYGALKSALKSKGKQYSDDRGFIFKTHARISAVESNPVVPEQYTVGDAAGNVRIFMDDARVADRIVPVPESISSLCYTFSGKSLFVSSFGGNIYHYRPLASMIYDGSPLGLGDSLRWDLLEVNWKERGNDLAILSVHNTALEDYLLVMGDVDITLIRNTSGNRYREVANFNLGKDLTALTVTQGNQDGTKFVVGGSDASVLFSFDPTETDDRKKMKKVRTVLHRNISVSAIAFQPLSASSVRAQIDGAPAENQRVAIGTETGDIWMTDISSFSTTGPLEDYLMQIINTKTSEAESLNFQESAITRLFFNQTGTDQTGNEQLISASLDGTVWMFNLDVSPHQANVFFEKGPDSGSWDHLRLITTGRSVDNLCLVNKNKIVSIENNSIRSWPTNLRSLQEKVKELLIDYNSLRK